MIEPPAHPTPSRAARPSRRQILGLAAGAVGTGLLARFAGPRLLQAADRATLERPNVVLFVIDTLRADRVNAYGYARPGVTPHLDALAEEAVLFQSAHAAAPWTLPSMASVFLSRFGCEHRALSIRSHLPTGTDTLAERLRSLRYTTLGLYANAMVGPEFGFDRGFDFYQASATNAAEQVQAALDLRPGSPYFLYLHNIEPHNPELDAPLFASGFRHVPQAARDELHRHYLAYRAAERIDFTAGRSPGLTDTTREQDAAMAGLQAGLADWSELYDSAVHLADRRLGSVVEYMKRQGAWDRTLFIAMADHGEEFFEHGGWSHGQAVYEEQLRVPLLIKFPNQRWGGTRVLQSVSLVDLMPTVFDVMECSGLVSDAAGRSLVPLCDPRGRPAPATPRITAYRENVMNHYGPRKRRIGDINVVVRDGRWKAIWNVEPDQVELFDVGSDPHERVDLAARNAARSEQMRSLAANWYEECGRRAALETPTAEGLSPEAVQRLRTLGYVD